MTDQELEQRLRAWYAGEVAETETAPADLRETLATIPATAPAPLRPLAGRRRISLLAVAAVLAVGGAVAVSSGALRPSPAVTPVPDVAVVPPASATPSALAALRPGGTIAFIRAVEKAGTCPDGPSTCSTARVWVVGSDGRGAHELFPDGVSNQSNMTWSPDGSGLFYLEGNAFYLTDPTGARRKADTGCVVPCASDSQVDISRDGRRVVFIREMGAPDYSSIVAAMDLTTGRVVELASTGTEGSARPAFSPDGRQIVFFRYGAKDDVAPVSSTSDAIWVIDSDGQDLRQISPSTLAAQDPEWSPDGQRILFESPDGEHQDIYTIRPDGTDIRRLTTDGVSTSATWTPDGRILFARGSEVPGWWVMDADGTAAALLVSAAAIGVAAADIGSTRPAWQPLGGDAIVAPPWTPTPAVAVGPLPSTPAPTPLPSLSPRFEWTGSMATGDGGPIGETATALADGSVLFAGGCSTAAEIYEPLGGRFSLTGPMAQTRAGMTATRLEDGRVLVTGGFDCVAAGSEGIRATAELYDPATGAFAPTGSMEAGREFHTATLLADGRVLITGGIAGPSPSGSTPVTLASYRLAETSGNVLATAELYDPATGTFSRTGSMTTFRDQHTATLLADGRVLVVGGGGEGYASQTKADVYDPATGKFSRTGSMKKGRWLHTATLLPDGRVLVVGGRSPKDSTYASAEAWDPATGTFNPAGTMGESRQQHTATLLGDGRVFIAGGYWSDGQAARVLSSTEVYDPATGAFSENGSMGAPREAHSATLLDDGRVLIAAGDDIGPKGGQAVTSAVLYQP